jgi:hypothetical protein
MAALTLADQQADALHPDRRASEEVPSAAEILYCAIKPAEREIVTTIKEASGELHYLAVAFHANGDAAAVWRYSDFGRVWNLIWNNLSRLDDHPLALLALDRARTLWALELPIDTEAANSLARRRLRPRKKGSPAWPPTRS